MSNNLDAVLQDVGVATVIVKLAPASSALALAAAAPRRRNTGLASLALESTAAAEGGSILSLFTSTEAIMADQGTAAAMMASVERRGASSFAAAARKPDADVYPNLGLAAGLVNRAGADALRARSDVEAVVIAPELSLIRPVNERAATSAQAQVSWGLNKLGIPALWEKGLKGKGIIVGHLDTGVDGTHPALAGAIHAFAEVDFDGKLVPGATAHDSDRHGTHTAGTIVARPVNGRHFGVAPEATIASAMVIENGKTIRRILKGMDWAVGQGIRVLSMSLGLRGYDNSFEVVVERLRANNVLPVFAVGNEYANSSRSPGNYATVLSVGAIDVDGSVADFSSSQVFNRAKDPLVPDLVAPGVRIPSCVPGGGLVVMDGTSMATPHIAGLAALLLQARPGTGVARLESAILQSCSPRLASIDASRGNNGLPKALAALNALLQGQQLLVTGAVSAPQPSRARVRKKAGARPKKPGQADARRGTRRAGKGKRATG